jgi:hypothetical protein
MFILKEDNPEMRRSIIFDQNCEAKKLIYPLSQDKIENIDYGIFKNIGNTGT